MNFNFDFGPSIQTQIEIFNEVLSQLDQAPLLESMDFVIDPHSAGVFQLIGRSVVSERNIIKLELHLLEDGLRLDAEDIPETFEWSAKEIDSRRSVIEKFLFDLLTCYIFVERSNRGIGIRFFNCNGVMIESIKVRKFGFFGDANAVGTEGHLYLPFYTTC